jgi:hypothetical protein
VVVIEQEPYPQRRQCQATGHYGRHKPESTMSQNRPGKRWQLTVSKNRLDQPPQPAAFTYAYGLYFGPRIHIVPEPRKHQR